MGLAKDHVKILAALEGSPLDPKRLGVALSSVGGTAFSLRPVEIATALNVLEIEGFVGRVPTILAVFTQPYYLTELGRAVVASSGEIPAQVKDRIAKAARLIASESTMPSLGRD